MKRIALLAGVFLLFAPAAAVAAPVFKRGGAPSSSEGGGYTYACDSNGTGVCADVSNGQTFVQWPDVLSAGVTDYTKRYRVVRSLSPINAGNFASATVIGSYNLPNSGQLLGGNPDIGGTQFTQANRQANNSSNPMTKIPDASNPGTTKTLTYATGLQVYTALATQNAYYAVASTTTSDASPSYIGSVGPMAESVASPAMIKYADSLSRGTSAGKIDIPVNNVPTMFNLHASGVGGGCAGTCQQGDYWESWGTTNEGWQDGTYTVFDARLDKVSFQQVTFVLANRDTVWATDGSGGIETMHQGLGLVPNPLVGAANKFYPMTYNRIQRFLNFAISHYSLDPNQLHCVGSSMGAWGCANTGMRMSPQFSAIWASHPQVRMDHFACYYWPGKIWGSWPFRATIDAAGCTLGQATRTCAAGSGASCITRSDGLRWGGTGGYVDTYNLATTSLGTDIPVMIWSNTNHDGYALWADQIDMVNALQTGKRGHAMMWFRGDHDTATGQGLVDCDFGAIISTACYHKGDFKLNAPYPALTHSSIDDNIGDNTILANGLPNGDESGCINCGFRWSFTTDNSGSLAFTLSNAYMGLTPPAPKTSTLSSGIDASIKTITVANGAVYGSLTQNFYFMVGDTAADQEVIWANSVSGNTINVHTRGVNGSTAKTHSAGVAVRQMVSQPTAPNAGPFSSMTVDVTPRRLQGFIKAPTTVLNCTYTPFGESPVSQTPTVTADGLFTLTGVKINSGGSTAIACS